MGETALTVVWVPVGCPHGIPGSLTLAHAAGRAGHTTRAEEFLTVKRTQLKHGGDQAVGEKLDMEALHVSSFLLKLLKRMRLFPMSYIVRMGLRCVPSR